MISDNSGKSFTLTNTLNLRRENSIRNSVFMSKEISTLSHKWDHKDTSTLLTIETWSLRLKMEEKLRFGISINSLRPLEQGIITNHGISRTQEKLLICKSGALTPDGSKFLNFKVNTSSIQMIIEYLMLQIQKMRKVKLLELLRETVGMVVLKTKDGR